MTRAEIRNKRYEVQFQKDGQFHSDTDDLPKAKLYARSLANWNLAAQIYDRVTHRIIFRAQAYAEKRRSLDVLEAGGSMPSNGSNMQNTAMNGAMRSASVAMTPAVTAAYNWSQFPVIADVGGGICTQLVSILDATPGSKGILFEKPHLRTESISHDRMEVISGDSYESVPAGADAYLLRWILHDWDDAAAAVILGALRRSMKPTARLIVIESVIPEGPAFNVGKWTDLQMLVCVGGRERTESEYRTLLSGAGFNLQEVVATASPLSLLVAKPV